MPFEWGKVGMQCGNGAHGKGYLYEQCMCEVQQQYNKLQVRLCAPAQLSNKDLPVQLLRRAGRRGGGEGAHLIGFLLSSEDLLVELLAL